MDVCNTKKILIKLISRVQIFEYLTLRGDGKLSLLLQSTRAGAGPGPSITHKPEPARAWFLG
jgi:hypothetical protein